MSIDAVALQTRYELDVFGKRGPTLVRGQGSQVWDATDRRYLDFIGGHGATILGHCHPAIVAALHAQAAELISCPGSFYHPQRARLMARLVEVAPSTIERVFLCNSGTESIEAALKFARASTGRTTIVSALNGFHGRSYGAMSASSYSRKEERFGPHLPGVRFVPLNDVAALDEAVDDTVAGILLEPVQGEGGVHPMSLEFAQAATRLCAERGALLIADEVQTGLGRTGLLFGCERLDLAPDILCLAKGLGGGFPVGAVGVSSRIELAVGGHGSTFGGNPLACAVANAVLDELTHTGFLEEVREKADEFVAALRDEAPPVVREIRALGMMVGIELRKRSRPVIAALAERGLLTLSAGSRVVRLLPPLTTTRAELDEARRMLLDVLGSA